MLLVGEVKSRQDAFELVENLVVPCHISGQNAPEMRTTNARHRVVLLSHERTYVKNNELT